MKHAIVRLTRAQAMALLHVANVELASGKLIDPRTCETARRALDAILSAFGAETGRTAGAVSTNLSKLEESKG
jgi:hypothetical protein